MKKRVKGLLIDGRLILRFYHQRLVLQLINHGSLRNPVVLSRILGSTKD